MMAAMCMVEPMSMAAALGFAIANVGVPGDPQCRNGLGSALSNSDIPNHGIQFLQEYSSL
jgi:hypothetical protein